MLLISVDDPGGRIVGLYQGYLPSISRDRAGIFTWLIWNWLYDFNFSNFKQIRWSNEHSDSFPEFEVLTRLFVTLPIGISSAERSFSVLRRTKNYSTTLVKSPFSWRITSERPLSVRGFSRLQLVIQARKSRESRQIRERDSSYLLPTLVSGDVIN